MALGTGGVVEAVADGRSGRLALPDDYPAFAAAVVSTLGARDDLRTACVEFARQFAWPEFGAQLSAHLLGGRSTCEGVVP